MSRYIEAQAIISTINGKVRLYRNQIKADKDVYIKKSIYSKYY